MSCRARERDTAVRGARRERGETHSRQPEDARVGTGAETDPNYYLLPLRAAATSAVHTRIDLTFTQESQLRAGASKRRVGGGEKGRAPWPGACAPELGARAPEFGARARAAVPPRPRTAQPAPGQGVRGAGGEREGSRRGAWRRAHCASRARVSYRSPCSLPSCRRARRTTPSGRSWSRSRSPWSPPLVWKQKCLRDSAWAE